MTKHPAGPRLYVYYRVPVGRLEDVVRDALAMQSQLVNAHPGLRAQLLRRTGTSNDELTLMEIYSMQGGLPPAWVACIDRASKVWSASIVRHTEWFEPVVSRS